MKISQLLIRLEELPQPMEEFDWAGVEQWHPEVFERGVKTLEEAINYIKELKDRVEQQSFVLHDLSERYNQIIHWIHQIEIEP